MLHLLLLAVLVGPPSGTEGEAWLQLDKELAALGQDLEPDHSGLSVSLYIKSSYRSSDDLVYSYDPTTFQPLGDLGGFAIDSMGLGVKGEFGDFTFKLGYNPLVDKLRSTYARFQASEHTQISMGRFKVPLLRSRLVSTTRLLFLDRTVQARATGPRELGLMVESDFTERVNLIVAIQNGADGTLEEKRVTGRLELALSGGGVSRYEGAYKAKDRVRTSLGLAASDDHSFDDGRVLALDLATTFDRWSLSGEVVDHGDDLGLYSKGLIDPATIMMRGGTRAWDVTASWMILDDRLELAGRVEGFDDPSHTRMVTFGLNKYFVGHSAKLQWNWIDVSSDIPGLESTVLALGFTLDA